MKWPCVPMARWVFGTNCSRLPGVLGTSPARRHAVHSHPWWPSRHGQGTAPVPPALHAAPPSPSPLAAPRGLAATPRCFTARHAREPGKLAGR